MGARLLQGEFIVLTRMAGPTRRDPRLEVGWVLGGLNEGLHPFLGTEGRRAFETPDLAANAEPLFLPE